MCLRKLLKTNFKEKANAYVKTGKTAVKHFKGTLNVRKGMSPEEIKETSKKEHSLIKEISVLLGMSVPFGLIAVLLIRVLGIHEIVALLIGLFIIEAFAMRAIRKNTPGLTTMHKFMVYTGTIPIRFFINIAICLTAIGYAPVYVAFLAPVGIILFMARFNTYYERR